MNSTSKHAGMGNTMFTTRGHNMKAAHIILLVCMVVVGLIIPLNTLIPYFEWRFTIHQSIILKTIPYVLLPIASYVGMKSGFKSKWTLTLTVTTLLVFFINIWLDYYCSKNMIFTIF